MLIDTKLAPLRKGLLEFVVLRIVGGDQVYVPDILKRLAGTEFATQEGTLYPLLSKLSREQLVEYEWRESELGPPRKYYRLTDAGLQQLAQLDEYWHRINHTLARLGSLQTGSSHS
jgi:PadR family transcriptional regulator PadR